MRYGLETYCYFLWLKNPPMFIVEDEFLPMLSYKKVYTVIKFVSHRITSRFSDVFPSEDHGTRVNASLANASKLE